MTRLTVFALPLLAALTAALLSQVGFSQSDHKPLPYELDPQWPQLPVGWNFQETPGVAVGPDQHVYVLHRGDHPIIEFDGTGRFVRSLGDGLFIRAHGIEVDREGNIWTVDNDTHMVLKMDPTGRVRMVLGRRGQSGEGEDSFNEPTDVAIAPNGDFYVSDGYGNSRVVKFSKDGTFITAWGKKGDGPGEFDLPHSVALDRQGRVYVGDRENYRIQVFDADGEFLHQWKHVGSPWGLDITADQTIFMADGRNNRVLKLDLDGKILGVLGGFGKRPGQFNYSHHLALDALGNLYVSEIKNWRVQRFVPK